MIECKKTETASADGVDEIIDRRVALRAVVFGRRKDDNGQKSASELRKLEMLSISMGEVIHRLMVDPTITEIMLNPDGRLWAESLGDGRFFTGSTLEPSVALSVIQLVASDRGTVCDEHSPRLAAELPGTGSRFQAQLPPIVVQPSFSIRKQALLVFTLDDYVEQGVLTPFQRDVIVTEVADSQNILIAGGTGSGKTTLANAVLAEIAATGDRVITLEDTLELQCSAKDHYAMRTVEGKVTLRDLVKDCLRLRPDRIVVGELRDGAALDLLKAWSTGHPGGVTTVHAGGADAALHRLCSVDLVIYIEKDRQTHRRAIKEICTVQGYDTKTQQFTTEIIA